jgi:hypothetical protein
MADRLTREELDTIIDGMTARDIFAAAPGGNDVSEVKGSETAGIAFEKAAERQGFGTEALDRVGASDAIYLANAIGEALNMGSPKAEGTEGLPTSPDSGDSLPS